MQARRSPLPRQAPPAKPIVRELHQLIELLDANGDEAWLKDVLLLFKHRVATVLQNPQ